MRGVLSGPQAKSRGRRRATRQSPVTTSIIHLHNRPGINTRANSCAPSGLVLILSPSTSLFRVEHNALPSIYSIEGFRRTETMDPNVDAMLIQFFNSQSPSIALRAGAVKEEYHKIPISTVFTLSLPKGSMSWEIVVSTCPRSPSELISYLTFSPPHHLPRSFPPPPQYHPKTPLQD